MPFPPKPDFKPIAHPDSVITAEHVRFTVMTDRILRLEYSPDNRFEDRPSQAFWYREQPVPMFKKTVSDSSIEIETDFLHLKYLFTAKGFTPKTLSIKLKQTGSTWCYGAPQKDNLKGTARTLDGVGGTLRLENGLLSRSGWAVVDDSQSLVFDELGWLESRKSAAATKGFRKIPPSRFSGDRDLYFFGYGTDYAACLRDFTAIAGKIPMIPRYILGNWWSRYWAFSQDELKSLMEEFRAHEIPLSVCIIDMDWHITKTGTASNGWTGYTWNRKLFPDPSGLMRWLHRQGLRTALNLHPAKGVYSHEQQYEQMAKWMNKNPATKQPIRFDITDPHFMEGYFKILHHPYEKDGVDFWWMDWQQGTESKVMGLDPLWMLNHLHYYDLGRVGRKRSFIFSRWGGLGNHRYPIGFSGDTLVRWSALAFQPRFTSTAANVAYGWWSHDIGGHMKKDGTPELYLRWVQFGVFSPIFRLHSSKRPELDRRPWGKPERIFQATRNAMQLRHALIPYVYSMAWRAYQTGISVVTPMYYGDVSDAAAYEAPDQYFFGSELIAAPITAPADPKTGVAVKRVWLPVGTWLNFFTGEAYKGGAWHEIKAGLEDIPVFAKAGAIVPLATKVKWGGIENPTEFDIYVFPGADNTFELYEDDGETTEYQRGKYAITRFSLKDEVFTIHPATGDTSVIPAQRAYHIHVGGANHNDELASFTLVPTESRMVKIPNYQLPTSMTLAISEDQFLLDGKPFRILSGAMHYFRVVPEYWHDRLQKMRAFGLNTIETYAAWNLHEPRPGEFHFDGMLDVVKFIETAADVGLKVIVRPGPYICSEWDFGGLPSWLLKDPDMQVRCAYPPYVAAVDQFFEALLPPLAPLQSTRGGPIIAMQVENEYGSYGNDEVYLRHLVDGLRSHGIDSFLFTSDGPRDNCLQGGTLGDVFKTVNFAFDAKEALAKLREYQPKGPRMVTEFWSGWFDHWGESHHIMADGSDSIQRSIDTLDEILAAGASVNFYMFHGGTNFGFMSGANGEPDPYQADVTSYDYACPLSEWGEPSVRYEAYRAVLKKYVDLPSTANIQPVTRHAYGTVEMTESVELFESLDGLSEPQRSLTALPMEMYDQDYGFILYRTLVSGPRMGTIHVRGLHDRAQLFLNGESGGILDRESGNEYSAIDISHDAQLDILVENMGRVNFGPALLDRKGITGGVTVNDQYQFGWVVYPLPLNDLSQLRFSNQVMTTVRMPAFFRAHFDVDEPADTFLALPGWTKGVVWLNGFNLGRYWERGPQKTLYVPAPLLKRGQNELIVFELHGMQNPVAEFRDASELG